MPKLILKTLVGYLADKRFKECFKGEWQLLEDDKVIYKFDPQTSLLIEIHAIANFFMNFVQFMNLIFNSKLQAEFIANADSTLDFKFKIETEDENKGYTWLYAMVLDYIGKHVDQISQKTCAAKVAVEFFDILIPDVDLPGIKIILHSSLIQLINKNSSLQIKKLEWKIDEHDSNYNIEIIFPEKSHLIEMFLRKIDNGLKPLLIDLHDLEKKSPKSFYIFEENKLVLDFEKLKVFTDVYPKFTMQDCLLGKINLERRKPRASLFKSKSNPNSNSSNSMINAEKSRLQSDPLFLDEAPQILPASENKSRKFFKGFALKNLLFNKKTSVRPRSDSGLLSKPYVEESQYFPQLSEINKEASLNKASLMEDQGNDKQEPLLKRTTKYKSFPPITRLNADKENVKENSLAPSQNVQPTIKSEKYQPENSDSEEDNKSATGCPALNMP